MKKRRIVLSSRPHRSPSLDESIVPLINIVFLLLIFFLAAGDLSEILSDGLMPPDSSSDQPFRAQDDWLGMDVDGMFVWRGHRVSRTELMAELDTGSINLPATLRLRVDSAASSGDLLPLLDDLRQRGVKQVQFLTLTRVSTDSL
jgi:biopolymer transport protein ExbD